MAMIRRLLVVAIAAVLGVTLLAAASKAQSSEVQYQQFAQALPALPALPGLSAPTGSGQTEWRPPPLGALLCDGLFALGSHGASGVGWAWKNIPGAVGNWLGDQCPMLNKSLQEGWDQANKELQNRACILEQEISGRCFSCQIVSMLYSISFKIGEVFFASVKGWVTVFASLFLVFWICWHLARLFSPFGLTEDGKTFWNRFAAVFLWATVVGGIAQVGGFAFYWGYVVEPVLGIFVGAADILIASVMGGIPGFGFELSCRAASTVMPGFDVTGSSRDTLVSMWCVTERMHRMISSGLILGITNLPTSFLQASMESLGVLVGSVILIVIFVMALVKFLFVMVDVIIRFAIGAATFPFALVAYIFPISRGIAVTSFRLVLYSGFLIFFMAVIVTLTTVLIGQGMRSVATNMQIFQLGPDQSLFSAMCARGRQPIGLQHWGFWWIALAGALVALMLGKAQEFAGRFADYADNAAVGGDLARAASATVGAAAAPAKGAVKFMGGFRKR
jgi:hypothetical protein